MATYSNIELTGKGVMSLRYQGASITTAILEVITNAVAARIPGTTAKVVVDIQDTGEDTARVMVADYGCGMNLDDLRNLKNYGSKSSSSPLNRYGTGFVTFMLKLTDAKLPFGVLSHKDGVTAVMEGPLKMRWGKASVKLYDTNDGIAQMDIVPDALIARYGEPTTVVYADCKKSALSSLQELKGKPRSKSKRLTDARRALAEHISVRYARLIANDGLNPPDAEIYVSELMVKNAKLGKKVLWDRPIRAFDIERLAPLDNGKEDSWILSVNGTKVRCSYYSGILNPKAAETAFMGVEPLGIYYQGNTATSGYMIIQDGLVTAVPLFSEIFETAEHPAYNHCAGYISIDGAPEDVLNMTVDKATICREGGDDLWETVFAHIRKKKELHPTQTDRSTGAADLQNVITRYYEKARANMSTDVACATNLAVDAVRVPVMVTEGGKNTVYVLAKTRYKNSARKREFLPVQLEDFIDLIKYGAYLVAKGIAVDKLILVAPLFSDNAIRDYVSAFQPALAAYGLDKKVQFMTVEEFWKKFE